jgi:hypothetical protein
MIVPGRIIIIITIVKLSKEIIVAYLIKEEILFLKETIKIKRIQLNAGNSNFKIMIVTLIVATLMTGITIEPIITEIPICLNENHKPTRIITGISATVITRSPGKYNNPGSLNAVMKETVGKETEILIEVEEAEEKDNIFVHFQYTQARQKRAFLFQ